jgi:putative membrane protein
MPDLAAKSAVTLDTSTRLAFDRTRVAYDRTMMAWIRTATSLITFGFGIYKFFQLDLAREPQPHRLIGPREFALLMVAAGQVALILGILEYWQSMRALRADYPGMARSRAGWVAAFVLMLGVLALIAMIFRQ